MRVKGTDQAPSDAEEFKFKVNESQIEDYWIDLHLYINPNTGEECETAVSFRIWWSNRELNPWIEGSLKWDGCMNVDAIHYCHAWQIDAVAALMKEIRKHGDMMPSWDGD